ncbi:four helix bundle protein [Brevundimonas viscosa]|uniref:Four helix bundle protein n=1 Tax=Brevundimonas viscosa TaxID=871741 RepID=A0A1I6P2P9_9CAUL|nr:four helix bundle protein [Brevundimonas viscosa]SFS34471.1 four helix bundle protein [Brevundimonas viscosa]
MSSDVRSYQDLDVWRFAVDWAELIYRTTAGWPRDERFGLVSQIRRSAVSVASNIAERPARRSTGEFLQFVGMAQGSLAEAETQLLIAARLGYLQQQEHRELTESAGRISRMLASLGSALKRRKSS